MPAIRVDEAGGINIVYFDNRNINIDSSQVYLSRSTDGGNTWKDFQVSDHNFKPKGISGAGSGNQGDNIGITSGNNTLWPVWMDDKTGVYQIWTAPIDLSTIGIRQLETSVPDGFVLEQNYPNPFNPSTVIRYSIPSDVKRQTSDVRLVVFDNLGKELLTLVNEKQSAGTYEVDFNAAGLPSGIYYYKLQAGDFIESKKMSLIK
ncbi:MAG: T9SS type A sorting domain-containing protein [Ignavibacteria bacterium]|nr:T9SS type A sorting domain-containing protein [Ignavibacteria bacterium]